MISWFKKHFIPHAGNDHHPHILRNSSVVGIVAIILFLETFSFLLPTLTHINTTGQMAAVLPAVLADLTNEEREAQNLEALKISPILNKAAEMKAADMATHGYFAHTSPEGKTPWYWLLQAGYKYQYAGENLAINFSDSKDVTAAWMASPTHRANIVKANYTEVGTGIASGIYKGQEAVFVAQVYANPLPEAQKPAEPVKINSPVATEKESGKVLGAEVAPKLEPLQNPTLWQKLSASPRNTTNLILYIIFAIIAIALLLYIFIKVRNHNIHPIKNGLMILAIIAAVFLANYYLSHRNMMILDSLNYSNQSK